MNGKFRAAFIIPLGAAKVLTENGWEFNSTNRLPMSIKDHLISAFKLQFVESYLGIDSYVNEGRKMSVFYDDQNRIESIYFQLGGSALKELLGFFHTSNLANESELFVPEIDWRRDQEHVHNSF